MTTAELRETFLLALTRDKVGAERAEPLCCGLCVETVVCRPELF